MAADQADVQDVPLPATNDTGITEDVTRLALEALVHFQLEEESNGRLPDNNKDGEFDSRR